MAKIIYIVKKVPDYDSIADEDLTPEKLWIISDPNNDGKLYSGTLSQLINLVGGYAPQGVTSAGAGGISVGQDLGTELISLQDLLDMVFYPYVAPSISISVNPSALIYEKGDVLAAVIIMATTVKHASDITSVLYYRNNVLISTNSSPNPNGGNESYTDTVDVVANTDFKAVVSDGSGNSTSNVKSYVFVGAYYYGVGAQGLSAAQVANLTKSVITENVSFTTNTSPTAQVYYFAYPAAYGVLTSILDTNGFETIGDYTLRVENITNDFGDTEAYNIYEFNNITTQTSFNNTYKQ